LTKSQLLSMLTSRYGDDMTSFFLFILQVAMVFYALPSTAEEIHKPSRWIGRVDVLNSRFGWPGSGFSIAFRGTELSVSLEDSGNNSLIVSNDDHSFRLNLKPGKNIYQLATNLPMGQHIIRVMRRTEGLFGDTTFMSAEADGAFVAVPEPKRRLLVIGDSISAGYGIEGKDRQCQFSADTENQTLTFGAIVGRRNDAEVTTLAISGIGVSRNDGGQASPTMSMRMDRPTPNIARMDDEDASDAVQYQAIVINLGTNDFSAGNRPDKFGGDYSALLQKLRNKQPSAMIYAALGPMLASADFVAAESAIKHAVETRRAAGDKNLRYLRLKNSLTGGTGCNWHPNVAAHEALADILNQALQHDLGWNAP
jgi:lysophospholipase L1-like esterase